jgi:type III secretion protein R
MNSINDLPNLIQLIVFGLLIGLVPFVAILTTSFVKLIVVFHMLRNALGIQQSPPNMVLNGIAIIITVFIMAPIGMEIRDTFKAEGVSLEDYKNPNYLNALEKGSQPLVGFLKRNTTSEDKKFFIDTTKKLWPKKYHNKATENNLLILMPAFVISELTSAFKIGFLIYLPFVIIDMVIANILLALGMMMMSPVTVSTPFKLLLFVLVEGWLGLLQGLILSYQ